MIRSFTLPAAESIREAIVTAAWSTRITRDNTTPRLLRLSATVMGVRDARIAARVEADGETLVELHGERDYWDRVTRYRAYVADEISVKTAWLVYRLARLIDEGMEAADNIYEYISILSPRDRATINARYKRLEAKTPRLEVRAYRRSLVDEVTVEAEPPLTPLENRVARLISFMSTLVSPVPRKTLIITDCSLADERCIEEVIGSI